MVVSVESHASEVGIEILKAGGNAFDAAAAVGFALAVTHPEAGNLGGGGFCVGLTAAGESFALDFRETAPAAATRDMFLDFDGKPIPGKSMRSHLAAGTPGSVEGLLQLVETRGKLDRRQVLAPAIRLAREGFPVSKELHTELARAAERLNVHAATRAIFFPDGEPLAFGTVLKQPDLAATLEAIARDGKTGFYEGHIANLIVAEMKRGGGIITADDLKGYRARDRKPFIFRSGEDEIITMPLPSSGGITLAQILGLADLGKLKDAGWGSARYVHLLAEAERLAYADRNFFLGDPEFNKVPVDRLISSEYLAERRKLMPDGRAGKSQGVTHGHPEAMQTTHYCVVDSSGNVAAVTTTLNGSFGMGAVVTGAGFLLNNEMDDFSIKPGEPNAYGLTGAEANAIAPGKRMLSSMTPTIVRKDGRFFMTIGSPGGSTIITTVLQIYLNATLFGMNIRDAIDAPRVHHQWLPDNILHEAHALSPDTIEILRTMGYSLKEAESIGVAAGIMRTSDGLLAGHADRRGDGAAAGY